MLHITTGRGQECWSPKHSHARTIRSKKKTAFWSLWGELDLRNNLFGDFNSESCKQGPSLWACVVSGHPACGTWCYYWEDTCLCALHWELTSLQDQGHRKATALVISCDPDLSTTLQSTIIVWILKVRQIRLEILKSLSSSLDSFQELRFKCRGPDWRHAEQGCCTGHCQCDGKVIIITITIQG